MFSYICYNFHFNSPWIVSSVYLYFMSLNILNMYNRNYFSLFNLQSRPDILIWCLSSSELAQAFLIFLKEQAGLIGLQALLELEIIILFKILIVLVSCLCPLFVVFWKMQCILRCTWFFVCRYTNLQYYVIFFMIIFDR